MGDTEDRKPANILKEILNDLQSNEVAIRLSAIMLLHKINFSSEAIRNELEKLALKDGNQDVRIEALAALDHVTQRNVRSRVNKIERGNRTILVQELMELEKLGLLEKQSADVIRRRYDFDLPAFSTNKPATVQAAVLHPEEITSENLTVAPSAKSIQPLMPESEGPRPSLLQTLLSEASIKIYLYLGAFFVIASASIIGAAVPELRLPILIIGTLIFGGLSLSIKKRLPQPSFALFIVFSFLFPITANAFEGTLRQNFDLTSTLRAGYWAFIYLSMAIIWGGSTWLYKSRLFSITAFISLTLAFIRVGDIFIVNTEFYTTLTGFAALAGLAGVWLLKKWKDANFALPLFLTVQVLQVITIISCLSIFGLQVLESTDPSPWQLASLVTWVIAFGFYILSDLLFPFLFFPWLAAGSLIPIPWFLVATFDVQSLGSTIIIFFWGASIASASEFARRLDAIRKYSLAILLASMPTFAIAIIVGFTDNIALGMIAALGLALIYGVLHMLHSRWWLWTLALLSFSISYFAFFDLEFIQKMDVFVGYKTLGISILFLIPDLFLKKDLMANPGWRLPPRIYGTLFALYTSITLLDQNKADPVAIGFAVYTLFFIAYAFAYRKAILGYLPAAYLALTLIFTFEYLRVDVWLPALTLLAIFYFVIGLAFRSKEPWSYMLRNSALAVGSVISFGVLLTLKETGGWYTLIFGLLFMAEMFLRRKGLFEVGLPIFYTIGAFLILRDFKFEQLTYHLLAYSLVWILTDLMVHFTYPNPRPLKGIVRSIGGLLAITSYGFLITESDASFAAIGFGIYTLLFLTATMIYRQPNLLYTFTLTLPLFTAFLFRDHDIPKWIHPVIVIAVLYYATGFTLRIRSRKHLAGWDLTLLYSGLGVGVVVSIAAPILGGLDAAIPIAFAATLWAVEAFAKKNAWLAFPANGLYLLAYFLILFELKVNELQYFSIGAALLGLIQHYLLVRAGSRSGAFIMGMISQFVLLGITYIEMINKNELFYFFVLFFQSLAVLVYGLVIRSRSLTLFPIFFVALGVITVVNSALEGVGAIFVIGCTGMLLLTLGILAVLMRERISKLGERLSEWRA